MHTAFSERFSFLCTRRPKEGLFQGQTSRYLSEFEEICRLGKGSYGKVVKVVNFVLLHTFTKQSKQTTLAKKT